MSRSVNPPTWYERWPARLEREQFEFGERYPELKLTTLENGRLAWVGPIKSTSGREYVVRIEYPEDYPLAAPRVYPLSVDPRRMTFDGKPPSMHECHYMSDGSLCLAFPAFETAHATAVSLADMAVFWLDGLESFVKTGKFDTDAGKRRLSQSRDKSVGHSTITVVGSAGDINIVGQAAAVGSRQSHDGGVNQLLVVGSEAVDAAVLAQELALVRAAMLKTAVDADQFEAVGAIATAEKAARAGDSGKLMEHIRKAGKWALDAATDVSTDVAAAVIKKSLGLP